jgi:hypothetical protein
LGLVGAAVSQVGLHMHDAHWGEPFMDAVRAVARSRVPLSAAEVADLQRSVQYLSWCRGQGGRGSRDPRARRGGSGRRCGASSSSSSSSSSRRQRVLRGVGGRGAYSSSRGKRQGGSSVLRLMGGVRGETGKHTMQPRAGTAAQ